MELSVFKLIKEQSEPLESIHWGAHSPGFGSQGTEPCAKGPGVGNCAEGAHQEKPTLLLQPALVAVLMLGEGRIKNL